MKKIKKNLQTIFCICLTINVLAQKKDSVEAKKLIFRNSFSNYVGFDGRTFGTNQWLLNSSLTYHTKDGWSFAATNGYWSEISSPSAVFDLNVAKKFKISPFSELELGYEREFISPNNTFLESTILNNNLTANFSVDTKYFLASLDAGYLFGGGTKAFYSSIELQGNLEKDNFLGADYFSLQPGIEIISGTYDIFNRTITKKINRKNMASKTTSTFDLLDYDFVVPLTYEKGRFNFILEYHYNIPVEYDATENLKPFSYIKFGLDFKIF